MDDTINYDLYPIPQVGNKKKHAQNLNLIQILQTLDRNNIISSHSMVHYLPFAATP